MAYEARFKKLSQIKHIRLAFEIYAFLCLWKFIYKFQLNLTVFFCRIEMENVEFRIFKKGRGPIITANRVVYGLGLISASFIYLIPKYLQEGVTEKIGVFGMFLTLVLMVILGFTKFFTRKSLSGTLDLVLKFCENEIGVGDKRFSLKDINKIEFTVRDYFDQMEYSESNLNPARSNGTSNTCRLILTNGTRIEVKFQLIEKFEFRKMRELLIHYHTNGKIHFLSLIDYLGINDYKEIQEFKKSLPK